jgi:putative chitinase
MSNFQFEFTEAKLARCLPGNNNVFKWFDSMNRILPKNDIVTVQRVASFVAQCAHESSNFNVLRENLNYRAETLTKIWPRLFPTNIANDYVRRANKQQAIANRAYANRMGNGSEESGDGWLFSGRGLIQLTGRENYTKFANYMNISVEEVVDFIITFDGAVESACWFWTTRNLNKLADTGDIVSMTRRINGGVIGLSDRVKKYNTTLNIFGE